MSDAAAAPARDDLIRTRLNRFLSNNPQCSIEHEGQVVIIREPWGDDTLEMRFRPDSDDDFDLLNSLLLPPLFSAVWHCDSRDLEFIYVPFEPDVYGRQFSFQFKGQSLRCEFGACSSRLWRLAQITLPVEPPSHTDYRNLRLFSTVPRNKTTKGTSFWIRDLAWNEDTVLEIARNLNFFMWHFDKETPRIRIHERGLLDRPSRLPRFLYDAFPGEISGRVLDTFLLQLWESFAIGVPIHRFLYGYQIIEYVSFYYLQENVSNAIQRTLRSPEVLERPAEAARQILDAVAEDKMEDAAKIEKAIDAHVEDGPLAAAILRDLTYFSKDQQFDGGFLLPALCSPTWQPKDKRDQKEMTRKVATALRKIRNAIVHSREARNVNSIAPTRANQDRISPWLGPLSRIVSDLILYSDI